MKRGLTYAFSLLLCLVTLSTQAKTLTPKQFHEWMFVDSDTVDYRWMKEEFIKEMNEKAKKTLAEFPQDPQTHYVFLYSVHATRWINSENFTLKLADSIKRVISEFENRTQEKYKGGEFYGTLAFCYNSMYGIYMAINELDAANAILELNEEALIKSLDGAPQESSIYQEGIFKLMGVYNNKAMILYKATHHLDSDSERKEAGPIMGKLLDKADSLGEIYLQHFKINEARSVRFITINTNQYLIYGGYFQDSAKAAAGLERAKVLLSSHCTDTASVYCRNGQSLLNTSIYYVRFARKEYAEAVKEGRRYFDYLTEMEKKYPDKALATNMRFDLLFTLTDSYFNLKKSDSAYYFGNLFLQDTIETKDYSSMSEIASMMAELSLDKDVNKAKEFIQLSKDCIRKSKSEQVRTKLVREGEIKLLNQSLERIIEVQESIRKNEEVRTQAITISLISGIVVSLIFAGYILRRLSLHKNTPHV
jgi:hypothetical protein